MDYQEEKTMLNEAITRAREIAKKNYLQGMLCHANPNDEELDGCIECARDHEQLAEWLEELQKYKQIGALEEVRDAVERQQAKKAILDKPIMILCCPSCGSYLQKVVDDEGSTEGFIPMYCKDCGQKIDADWSEEK